MPSQRIYGFDYGKGLAIVGMLLAHTFEGGICNWDHRAESSYLQRIPTVVIVILSPIALICLMGLFFTFITSITCSISVMRIEKKGKKAVMAYFLYRFMFGVVLKLMYTFLLNWWDKFGLFDTMKIAFPETELSTSGNTLDSIGACGFLVPVAVYYIRKLPFARDWKVQVGILTSVAVVLLYFYLNIADFAILLSDWFKKYRFNFISMLLSIVGTRSLHDRAMSPLRPRGRRARHHHDELEEVEASLDLHRYSRSRLHRRRHHLLYHKR